MSPRRWQACWIALVSAVAGVFVLRSRDKLDGPHGPYPAQVAYVGVAFGPVGGEALEGFAKGDGFGGEIGFVDGLEDGQGCLTGYGVAAHGGAERAGRE